MASETTAAPPLADPDADGLVGEVKIWPSHTLPGPKWLFCDGAAVSRTKYSLLYSRIGEEHGVGDGSTTFNLPNYTGRFLVGYNASDADFDNIGDQGGTKSVNTSAHTHSTPNHSHGVNITSGGESVSGVTVQSGSGASVAATPHTHGVVGNTATEGSGTTGSGGGETLATLPPYTVSRFIIKAL